MRVKVWKENGVSTVHQGIRGLSVDTQFGTVGDLILLRSYNSPNMPIRVKRWEWDGISIDKDLEGEKA